MVDGLVLNIDKRGKDLRVIDRHIHLPSAVEVYHPGMQVNSKNVASSIASLKANSHAL